jgi:hypothetical protein
MTEQQVGVVGQRWLRGVSGGMAVFCGLVALLLSVFLVSMASGNAIMMMTGKPVNWSHTTPVGGAHGNFHTKSRTCSGKPMKCRDNLKPIPAKEWAPLTAGYATSLIPTVALTYGLFQACLCFVGMARARFLHRQTVSRLMRFAAGGLVFVLGNPFSGHMGRAAAVAVDWGIRLVTQDRGWSFFSGFPVKFAGLQGPLMTIYAITLTVIAVVMVKASTIADDHAQIV